MTGEMVGDIPSIERSYEWLDPTGVVESARQMSGQEYLAAWKRGELTPPMAATLGFHLHSFGDGEVEIRCTPEGFHYNPYGSVHGGLAATLLDSATGCAVHSRLPAGAGYATVNLAINYLKAITSATGDLRCVGEVVSLGRTVAVSEAELTDAAGRLLARGTATCVLVNPPS